MKQVYIASPFFDKNEIKNVKEVKKILKEKGLKPFVPMENDISPEEKEVCSNEEWSKKVFCIDKEGIDNSDIVVLLYYGLNSDSGTSWECGYAYAKNKPVIVCNMTNNKEISNLMIVNGCHSFLNGIKQLIDFNFITLKPIKRYPKQIG